MSTITGMTEVGDVSRSFAIASENVVTMSTNAGTVESPKATKLQREPDTVQRTASLRYECQSVLRECEEALDRILDNSEDPVLRSNSFSQFEEALSQLWGMRTNYVEAFAETVNSLQCLIRGRNEDSFAASEIDVVRSAVRIVLDAKEIDDELANEVTDTLLRGGLDVFRELD